MADMALAGLRWAASPIYNKLIADASAYLGVDMVRELQELEVTVLPQFDLVIEAAEKSPHKDKLKAWLQRLKEAFYSTEDLLDEQEYNLLKRKAKSRKDCSLGIDGSSSSKSTIQECLEPLRFAASRARNLLPENRKLICKMKDLKAIIAEAKSFRELLGIQAGNNTGAVSATVVLPATSLPPRKVFGRTTDRDSIIEILTKESAGEACSANYSGVAIVAHGGAGKSTLAQYVYNDDRVKKHFDVRLWVSISRKLDIQRHTREIIESAAREECPHINNLDTLQCKLREILQKSEKFLLVMDDVWFQESDNETEWHDLVAPLVSQQAGSKILVTSRRDVLPAALCCKEVVRLRNMEDAELLALFKHHAFSGSEIVDPQLREKLENVVEKIVKRLGQSPLAAKVVGSQLSRKKDINAWKDALTNKNLSEPMRALLWSFEKLDPTLQRCFLYCSLFPKGHKYKIDDLVHLWVAEGLVDSCNQNRILEDIGRNYFNVMVSGSFFQPLSEGPDPAYIIHDLLHDLAESLSRDDYFRLEDDNVTEISCTVRHLSVRVESMKRHEKTICTLHHLRTVICIDPLIDDVSDVFQVCQHLKKLRVLYLSGYNSGNLPESVGEMKHLRYLNLIKTLISELPRSLGTVYHLQFLKFNHIVQNLPAELCNLSKLRHLQGYRDHIDVMYEESPPQIPNIGKLTSLQELHKFSVQRKKGYDLRQLRDMNELGGNLKIKNLENVTGKDEALESHLYKKTRLTNLRFAWSSENGIDADNSLHLEIMEGLKPPPQLKHLSIKGYKSDTYPSWLLEGSHLEDLESFGLHNCCALEGLPLDTGLFRHCSELSLFNIPKLKTLSHLPVTLKSLKIGGCPLLMFITEDELEQHYQWVNMTRTDHLAQRLALNMEIWEEELGPYVRSTLTKEYSSLEKLMPLMEDNIEKHLQTIKCALKEEGDEVFVKEDIIKAWLCCHEQRIRLICGRNIALPLVPASGLRHLTLSSCSITDGALAVCLNGLTSLERLELHNIMTLTMLPSEEIFQHLRKLEYMIVNSCWCLTSLRGLRAAMSLSNIKLWSCPSLELARGAEFLPLSLGDLWIDNCILAADSFSIGLPYLKYLFLDHCRSSSSISIGQLTSLEELNLRTLPDLCFLEGLASLQLHKAHLEDVPKLTTECISQYRVQKSLCVSSFELLNHMLSAEGFTIPASLMFKCSKEPFASFDDPKIFSSVSVLTLRYCKMESLPRNLNCLSSLEKLGIEYCPNISSLPDLPSSLRYLVIWGCERLKESCLAPDGESWPKISHIRWKDIR